MIPNKPRKWQKNPSNSPAMKRAQKINWALLQVSGAESNLRVQMHELSSIIKQEPSLKDELLPIYNQMLMAKDRLRFIKEQIKELNERRKQERKQNGNRES